MLSHKPDSGRIPRPRGVASQPQKVSSPTTVTSAKQSGIPAMLSPRPPVGSPVSSSNRASSASLSLVEVKGQLGTPSNPSRTQSSQGSRLLLPPRATTHPLPSTSRPSAFSNVNSNLSPAESSYTVSISSGASRQNFVSSHPRNVLRRKPPTIGQYTAGNESKIMEGTRPEKLNVIIPNGEQPSSITRHSPRILESPKQSIPMHSSQSTLRDRNVSYTTNKVSHGPIELASLRNTVNTTNLPPPTPGFASSSSPSTRYSGSPGIWSRTSTPTSLSSYSPGIVQPVKIGSRLRQPSPSQTRLPTFSPRIQPTPSPSNPASAKEVSSHSLSQGTGSTASLPKDGKKGSPTKVDATASPTTLKSTVQRRPSTQSNLPRMAKVNYEANQNIKASKPQNMAELHGDGRKVAGCLSINTAQVPSRPSREGTHRLELEPSPVVQSNLSPDTVTGHKRRGSMESPLIIDKSLLPTDQSAATSVGSLHSRASSRIPSRLPTSPELSRKPPRILTKEPKGQQSPASPGKSRRFGFFTKKSKSELNTISPDEPHPSRKGPAAGTGHEGYGRYGQRGRKTSIGSSSGIRERSTSTTRSTSKSVSSGKGSDKIRPDLGLDDFFLDRLEPVIILGGGMDGGALTRTQSEQSSSGFSTRSMSNVTPHSNIPQSPGYSTDSLATSTGTVEKKGESQQRNNHQGEIHHGPGVRGSSSLSSTEDLETHPRLKVGPETSQQHITQPMQGTPKVSIPKVSPKPEVVNNPKINEKSPPKKGLGLKWNFFQRSHDTKHDEQQPLSPTIPQLQATISSVASRRPVAHYAFVDTDSDPLEEIIHNIEDSPPTEDGGAGSPVEVPAALNIRKPCQSILLPSPPKINGEFIQGGPPSPKVYFTKDPLHSSPEKPRESLEERRHSRLASIGRIPRVVSRRERQHKPAFQSFSRPFSAAESPSLTAPVVDRPAEFSPPRPVYESQTQNLPRGPHNPGFDPSQPFGDPSSASILDFIAGPYSKNEFLTFSPENHSTTSSSSGSESLAAVTAVIPTPDSGLNEDEVWGEFDDLIDHVLSPEVTRSVSSGEHDVEGKLEMATIASRALQAELSGLADKSAVSSVLEHPAVELTPASPRSSNGSIRLRRSRIVSALHSSIAPSSQPSFSDIIAGYSDDQVVDNAKNEGQNDQSTIALDEQPSSYLSSPLNPSPGFEACRQRNTILFDIAERDREGPTAQTNIRSGSLMTSRWLSFGRVLFSPAHNRIKDGEDERILVVDGLGNDDWSFYCALTYPKADVHCLNDGSVPTASKHPAAWEPPSNHHTIHHSSFEDPFPFSKGFFTVTVLRFPAACSESAQNSIVSECKRVLRPGGYMEMSVLDLDMVNMGIRTRKAVRQLKERTYLTDLNISLKPASDSIQRLLGRHGFDNLRRCMVRIPTAGVIVRSSGSSSSTSSSASNPSTMATTATPLTAFSGPSNSSLGAQSKAHGKSNDTDLSLGDLLSDPSPSLSNDESIRKIVAKVGRWWYTRCYEIPVLPNGDSSLSIWADRKVLRECQKQGTGFRLLIAYAQKPSEKRRTASV